MVDINAPGRTADQLNRWAQPIANRAGLPVTALEAYANATQTLAQSRPQCRLAWTTLAGIAYVETRHGSYGGSTLGLDGTVAPPIFGIKLDGSPGFADIADTDGGVLDGDTEHDRAVGPFQFIPESWKKYGADANGDGRVDPHQIDDAAVAAARLLCTKGGDLSTPEGWQRGVLSYNQSAQYARDVRDAASAYSVQTRPR